MIFFPLKPRCVHLLEHVFFFPLSEFHSDQKKKNREQERRDKFEKPKNQLYKQNDDLLPDYRSDIGGAVVPEGTREERGSRVHLRGPELVVREAVRGERTRDRDRVPVHQEVRAILRDGELRDVRARFVRRPQWGAKLVGPDASAATFQFSRRSEFAAVHFVTDLRRVKGEDEIYQHLAANTYLIDLALTDENVRDATEEHASVMELVHDHVFLQKSLPSWITVKRGKDPAAVPLCQPAPSCLICSKRALLTPDIMQKLWLAKQGRRLWLGSAAIAALMS